MAIRSSIISKIPRIKKSLPRKRRAAKPRPASEITVYAEFFSIRRDLDYLYFRAGPTPGHTCSNSSLVQNYQVPLLDVVSIGPQTTCGPGRGWYKKIKFIWPD